MSLSNILTSDVGSPSNVQWANLTVNNLQVGSLTSVTAPTVVFQKVVTAIAGAGSYVLTPQLLFDGLISISSTNVGLTTATGSQIYSALANLLGHSPVGASFDFKIVINYASPSNDSLLSGTGVTFVQSGVANTTPTTLTLTTTLNVTALVTGLNTVNMYF